MTAELNRLGLRVLLGILADEPAPCSVTDIARSLGEEKYTISRMAGQFERNGWLCRDDARKLRLTDSGRSLAQRYAARVDALMKALRGSGIDLAQAKTDALQSALVLSDQTVQVISRFGHLEQIKSELEANRIYSGVQIGERLGAGRYEAPFVIYKAKSGGADNLSMANDGFENPCMIDVSASAAAVEIHAIALNKKSRFGGELLRGRVQSLSYHHNGRFIRAEQMAGVIAIPLEAFRFRRFGGGNRLLLHGTVRIRLQVGVGVAHMPDSEAILAVIL